MTGADVCSADVVLRGEHIKDLVATLREAAATGKAVRLFVDTTCEEPIITVWAGDELVGDEVPVAGVVFE
jgi:hypothetical protein